MAFKYFPCVAGDKEPALAGDWRGHATDNEETIQGWLDAGLNLALDCEASGITVIDLDGGEIGEATWQRLQAEHGSAGETYTVRTPRGGRHLYFVGRAASSVQKLGPKVDTRGLGGYVLCPPSMVGGSPYEEIHQTAVAPLPTWVARAVEADRSSARATIEELDRPENIARAALWLQERRPAVEGQGGNDHTYRTAAAALDLGLSPETAVELMLEHFNPRCNPPWEEEDLETIVENASNYQQNEGGAWALSGSPTERFASSGLAHSVEGKPSDNPFRLWTVGEALARPPPTWIMPGTVPREALLLLFGLPEAGKSWIALDLCLHVASGRAGWGRGESEPEDVIFFCGEGFADLIHNRVVAWCKARGVPLESLRLRLLENFPSMTDGAQLKLLSDAINEAHLKPALIVLDTYARVMAESGLGENDPKEVMQFVHQAERIKRGFRCTVIPIHHSGKDTERGARGSNSLIAAVDVAWEMTAHWSTRAFQLSCAKMKVAVKPGPLHFEAHDAPPGLVFDPIDAATYRSLTLGESELDSKKVSVALVGLKAIGHDHGVSTSLLAATLYQHSVDEKPEVTIANRERLAKQLNAAAKRHLAAWAERDPRGWTWFVAG